VASDLIQTGIVNAEKCMWKIISIYNYSQQLRNGNLVISAIKMSNAAPRLMKI